MNSVEEARMNSTDWRLIPDWETGKHNVSWSETGQWYSLRLSGLILLVVQGKKVVSECISGQIGFQIRESWHGRE